MLPTSFPQPNFSLDGQILCCTLIESASKCNSWANKNLEDQICSWSNNFFQINMLASKQLQEPFPPASFRFNTACLIYEGCPTACISCLLGGFSMCGRDSVTSIRMRTGCERNTFRSAFRQAIIAHEETRDGTVADRQWKITVLWKLRPAFSLSHSIWFMVSLQ